MAGFFDLFRRGNLDDSNSQQSAIIEDLDKVKEQSSKHMQKVYESHIDEDISDNGLLSGNIETITESVVQHSAEDVSRLISNDDYYSDQLLSTLRTGYNLDETYYENEEMSRDSVIGGAMEVITDDACQRDERSQKFVMVDSSDEKLAKFLQDFLDNNVGIDNRIWTWAFGIVEHGDFKLRRCEYYIGTHEDGVKNVYYEDVLNPYKVTRIEYMGKVLGFRDEDLEDNKTTFEKADKFVHFLSVKNSRREKVRVSFKNQDNELESVTCYKVFGTSLMDNARYIYRIVNLLDNMLILARVARSTQYNLVKIEVGNASPAKTQQILSDVRRRFEGATKMKKNTALKTDPSPIPINSNIYLPTREGKGEIVVDSISNDADLHSIVDIDYFKDKEFATLRVPKAYLGFSSDDLSTLANNSLLRMDARYARSVQRVQSILINGITDLCKNYLDYRGRHSDTTNFSIRMRALNTVDSMDKIETFMTSMQAFDSLNGFLETYGQYIDKAKVLKSTLNLVGLSPSEIASEEFLQILKEMEEGTYKEENHKPKEHADGEGDDMKW